MLGLLEFSVPEPKLLKRVYNLHLDLYRELNDIHIFLSHTLPLLEDTVERYRSIRSTTDKSFLVPSRFGRKGVAKRTPKEIAALFERFAQRDLHANILVACISRFESMLNDVLRSFLAGYPEKLTVGLKGGDSGKQLPISVVVEAETIAEARKLVADSRLQGVFYAEPKDYLAYFENITGVKIPEKTFMSFVEIKATRDLIIHNNGTVNDLYTRKAGKAARAEVGEIIPLDEQYFASAISTMKAISSEIEKQVRAAFT